MSMVQYCFTFTETIRLVRTWSPGRPPRLSQLLNSELYVAGPHFRCKCDGVGGWGGVCACELDGALGGDLSFEVLKRGGLHLVVTEVVPIGGGADKKSFQLCCVVFE